MSAPVITEVMPGHPDYDDDPEQPTVSRVYRLTVGKFYLKAVALALANAKDRDGAESLSLDQVARRTSYSARTTRKHLNTLHVLGLVVPLPPDRWALRFPDS